MAKWMVAAKKADFNKIAKDYGITPVLARIMRNRDICEDKDIQMFLNGTMDDLHDPFLLKGMEQATELILSKIREEKAIRIIGDYDVDGICSTYILEQGISHLSGKVDRVIPHRIKDGYGLNDSLIEEAGKANIDTVLTCDNGIAAAPSIALAKKMGMTVVVTDHHEVPFEEKDGEKHFLLPGADVVIDPRQPDCEYPYKQICGAVVAYKVIQALLTKAGEEKEKKQKLLKELLPFAALATVCDVMELLDENRIIVKYGLKAMNETKNYGLKALLQVNGIDQKEITPYHAGFIIGPCLNATGRLDSADRALHLFEETQWKDAMVEAADLKSLNDSRKKMTEDGVAQAIRQVEESSLRNDSVLVVYLPECHESIAGIIAGKVKERFHKPSFVLTKGEEGIKGSGRSIEAYSMYDEMTRCRELFTKYGGHKMAAGLSLAKEEDIELLRRALNENCTLTEEDFQEVVHIDVPMPLSYADRAFIRELSYLEPFGTGNPKPLFAQKNISLLSGRVLGRNKNVGKYVIADEEGKIYDMIYFGDLNRLHEFLADKYGKKTVDFLYEGRLKRGEMIISMAYYPDINVYAGRENIQIVMQYYC
ncbi:MAG: single-stranded-DNA-specific exonuclease RecJ [Suilimivivens sp.]